MGWIVLLVFFNVLKGIPGVAIYLNDTVTGHTKEEHLRNLELVLQRLSTYGLKLKREKCSFMDKEVHYVDYKLSEGGVHTSDEKVEAINKFPVPKTKQELSTFCGMVKYYHRFLPCISQVMSLLYTLGKVSSEWRWGKEENKAFLHAKELLKSNTLLVHCDPTKPLYLTCDANSFGLGVVLEQKCEKGILKPVCYASRTLSKSEKNYSQTGLAVVWAAVRFNKYLYSRKFQIWTNHKPLLGLLGEKKAVPQIASGRIIHCH